MGGATAPSVPRGAAPRPGGVADARGPGRPLRLRPRGRRVSARALLYAQQGRGTDLLLHHSPRDGARVSTKTDIKVLLPLLYGNLYGCYYYTLLLSLLVCCCCHKMASVLVERPSINSHLRYYYYRAVILTTNVTLYCS